MAKVLDSISFDAPTGPITPAVSDTFSFTGTPGFTGSGGVQRYDFKWEVDGGGGYVTIAASGTGLITAGTNPVTNSNSQAAQSITVTCDAAGSYTIRMVGAPTTGGSYTVLSSTETVTVSAAPVSVGITTNLGTGAVGSFAAAVIIALSGVSGTGSVGTVVPSASNSVAASGNAATGSVGTLAAAISVALSGEQGTGAVGTVVPSSGGAPVNLEISGNTATGSVGTVSASYSLALTGNEGTGLGGSLTPSFTLPLSGEAATGELGTLVSGFSLALSGNEITGSIGNLTETINITLDGNNITGYAGLLSVLGAPEVISRSGSSLAARHIRRRMNRR